MPTLAYIRGWLYHPAIPVYECVKALITERHINRGGYPHIWVLPVDPNQFLGLHVSQR